jgi:hypothetical protein
MLRENDFLFNLLKNSCDKIKKEKQEFFQEINEEEINMKFLIFKMMSFLLLGPSIKKKD